VAALDPATAAKLRDSGLADPSAAPFDVTDHPLVHCAAAFNVGEVFASQQFGFYVELTLNGPTPLHFLRLSVRCSEKSLAVEIVDDGSTGGESFALLRSEELTFEPGQARRFEFRDTAQREGDIHFVELTLALTDTVSLRWEALPCDAIGAASSVSNPQSIGFTSLRVSAARWISLPCKFPLSVR
jgi:hypothetical protein